MGIKEQKRKNEKKAERGISPENIQKALKKVKEKLLKFLEVVKGLLAKAGPLKDAAAGQIRKVKGGQPGAAGTRREPAGRAASGDMTAGGTEREERFTTARRISQEGRIQTQEMSREDRGRIQTREMSREDRDRRMRARQMKLRRRRRNLLIKMGAACLLIILVVVFGVRAIVVKPRQAREKREAEAIEKLIAKADRQAAMYDYDAAIKTIKSYEGNYEEKANLVKAVNKYEETKASCEPYPIDEITHIFFHVLIQDPAEAFGENSQMPDGLNIYMATVEEFNKIMESMYEKGYVLVRLSDVAPCTKDEDGNAVFDEEGGQIMLPPGKKPFVLSQDDVCYYHSYEHSGMADKLVIDENGDVKNEYTDADGNTSIGDYDMIPLLDTFLDKHPDFSYRGAKGIIALTGYNGILGYRTDPTYNTEEDRDSHQQKWLDEHPDFNYEEECENAKKVAEALKKDGWEFASHSWGHVWQDKLGDDGFATDAKKWMERVSPLIGGTDIWIYSNGEDVDNSQYAERFKVLRDYGFNYFCPVNSNLYSTEIYSDYMKQGRRNIDGYRMYYDMIDEDVDRLSDLFDVEEVFDKARPTPVPEI